MSGSNSQKIDKYYLGLTVTLILMAVLLVFSFRGVFSAFLISLTFDPSAVGGQVRVDQTSLDEAYIWAFKRETVTLNTVNQ